MLDFYLLPTTSGICPVRCPYFTTILSFLQAGSRHSLDKKLYKFSHKICAFCFFKETQTIQYSRHIGPCQLRFISHAHLLNHLVNASSLFHFQMHLRIVIARFCRHFHLLSELRLQQHKLRARPLPELLHNRIHSLLDFSTIFTILIIFHLTNPATQNVIQYTHHIEIL